MDQTTVLNLFSQWLLLQHLIDFDSVQLKVGLMLARRHSKICISQLGRRQARIYLWLFHLSFLFGQSLDLRCDYLQQIVIAN